MQNDIQIIVGLIDEGRAGGYVQFCDSALIDFVQVLHERPEAVPVRGDYDIFGQI